MDYEEFIESTWYLYRVRESPLLLYLRRLIGRVIQATRDPFYLDVGERVLFDLITRAKVKCGISGIQDLRTNKQDDRMESFVLSETLKVINTFTLLIPVHLLQAVPIPAFR